MDIKNKNVVRVLAILVGGILISMLLITLKSKPEPQPATPNLPQPANVVKVELVRQSVVIKSQGTVTPKIDIELTAQVSGQVMAVTDTFAVGGLFKANETLLHIDARDYYIQLAKAQAVLATAQKDLATEKGLALQAKRQWKNLHDSEANDLFLRKPQVAAAKAELLAAQAGVDQANLNIERTRINSPFAGMVARTDVNRGQYVVAGSTVGQIFAVDLMEIRLPLSTHQAQLLNMKMGSTALMPLKAQLTMTVGDVDHRWPAEIVRVDPKIDPTSRMFYVIAEVQQPVAAAGHDIAQSDVNALSDVNVPGEVNTKDLSSAGINPLANTSLEVNPSLASSTPVSSTKASSPASQAEIVPTAMINTRHEPERMPIVAGSFMEAEITSLPYDNVAILPRAALYQRDKVMLLDKDHHLRVVNIELLEVSARQLVVKGLQSGDFVLIKPPAFVELGVEYSPVFVDGVTDEMTSGVASGMPSGMKAP